MLPNFGIRHHYRRGIVDPCGRTDSERQRIDVCSESRRSGVLWLSQNQREYYCQTIGKKEDVASTVFDKFRFRIITKTKDDLLPLVVWLHREVFAYNFVIPGQSHNNLMAFKKMIESQVLERPPSNGILEEDVMESPNEFSSSTYRVINSIVDVPVRIDRFINHAFDDGLGRIVFVMAEFQIVDQETAITNEEGDKLP